MNYSSREPVVLHTIDIFDALYQYVLPVAPDHIRDEMKQALEQLRGDFDLSLNAVEDTMIVFGKQVWPYRKAYGELLSIYEGKLGEQFLFARLTKPMQKKYQTFVQCGGSVRDIMACKPTTLFSLDERNDLVAVLVGVRNDLRSHVAQAIHTTEKKQFQQKVSEFSHILHDIETRLSSLRSMADAEQEHPQLADEIRSQVRSFELSLCFLGPDVSHDEVCRATDHFTGRKRELRVKV